MEKPIELSNENDPDEYDILGQIPKGFIFIFKNK